MGLDPGGGSRGASLGGLGIRAMAPPFVARTVGETERVSETGSTLARAGV